jgi:hypothetical protein
LFALALAGGQKVEVVEACCQVAESNPIGGQFSLNSWIYISLLGESSRACATIGKALCTAAQTRACLGVTTSLCLVLLGLGLPCLSTLVLLSR